MIIASVVSMPPNIMTAAFDTTSGSARTATASRSTDGSAERRPARTCSSSWRIAADGCRGRPARRGSRRSRRPRCRGTSPAPSPRRRAVALARSRRPPRTAARRPRRADPPRRAVADAIDQVAGEHLHLGAEALLDPARPVRRRRTQLRCKRCWAPSSESMLRPTTCAVEKRGSSTVKADVIAHHPAGVLVRRDQPRPDGRHPGDRVARRAIGPAPPPRPARQAAPARASRACRRSSGEPRRSISERRRNGTKGTACHFGKQFGV